MYLFGLSTNNNDVKRSKLVRRRILLPERILKFGGVKIRNLVPPVKINRFVNRLPVNKRDSLFEIASELQMAGLIDVLNSRSQSTIDKDTIDDQMTNTGNFAHDIKGFKRHTEDTLNLPK
jgi:hypothetical protein